MNWEFLDQEYLLPAYARLPLTITKGEGCYLYDSNNQKYLDMFAGVGVNQLGYNHPELTKTLIEQSSKAIHLPLHFHNPVAIEYAQKLVKLSKIEGKVFYTTSGAEATEAALKFVHKFKIRTKDRRNNIVVFKKSFHGRTLGAIGFTRQPHIYQDFPHSIFKVIEIEADSIEELSEAFQNEAPLAILMEPVLGSGGVIPISDEFMKKARELCDQTNALLIMDEVQAGLGRTGTFFAHQTSGIKPDCILFGKGAGGGISLGGVIAGEKLTNTFQRGDHGTTWAHPPLATALGSKVIDILLRDNLIDSREKSSLLLKGLQSLQTNNPHLIKEIRNKGLMFGITMNLEAEQMKTLQLELLEKGVLIDVTQGNIIRLLPPLIIEKEELTEFLSKFGQILQEVSISDLTLSKAGGSN